jgi:HlyD family secretion protein
MRPSTRFRSLGTGFLIASLLLITIAACSEPPPANEVRVSGHVEATTVRLAAKAGGRIVTLAVKEGDRVEAGAMILHLDTRDAELAIQRAKADRAQAEAQLRLVQAGARPEDIRQADAQTQAARDEVQAARAELQAADKDLERFEALLQANAGSQKQRDDAATRRDVARERVQAAESRVRALEQSGVRLRAGSRREEVDVARARVAAADTQIASAEETLADATLVSPVGGVVTEKLAEAGEIIAPRTPVVVLTDLSRPWADVFVPETAIPRIRIGQTATLFTDAGGAGLPGSITYISPKAEFTPRNVQTAEERSKLVYRVRISADNKDGILKQGMPVEAVIPLTPQ